MGGQRWWTPKAGFPQADGAGFPSKNCLMRSGQSIKEKKQKTLIRGKLGQVSLKSKVKPLTNDVVGPATGSSLILVFCSPTNHPIEEALL